MYAIVGLSIATRIPVSQWLAQHDSDPRVVSTAFEILRKQAEEVDDKPPHPENSGWQMSG